MPTAVGFHLRQLTRNSFFVQLAVTSPVVFLLLRYLVARGAHAHIDATAWVDAVVVGLWTTTTTATGIIGYQRFQGTLEPMLLSPRSPGAVLTPVVVSTALLGTVALPVTLGLVTILHGAPGVSSWPSLLDGFALAVIGCAASATCLAGLFVLTRYALVYESVLLTPVLLLSGAVAASDRLPEWALWLSWGSPLSGAVRVLHAAATGIDHAATGWWTAASLLASAVHLLAARVIMRLALRRARRDGSLALS
ncbi:MAG TPA: ABC transporter permease [Stackebrandtia sp.]|jgi:ABC-2 type transport system permease protein|uniref:ABC transporter permease n=1 Tax=Stackebrandtia sp. TaxID=2023065 RepID=UPI002D46D2C6|nr:ABC transporter permease [Stackebrandtia sp.]HZE40870.1 ABC transporter permease [Stackebrandtia sp.]